jgi:hypothetical protein
MLSVSSPKPEHLCWKFGTVKLTRKSLDFQAKNFLFI